ncbi:MAG: nucleoside phosphorylase [Nanoarchaeota archaeon]|nr:nucleoside phosphorylase [Nanoarchaeota archaeon]
MTGIGAPNAAAVFEELIALGGKEFLNIGTSGGLHHEGIFLCEKALRDEGTSYHYLPDGKFIYPDKDLTEKFRKSIEKNRLEYFKGITWTIDAPYRETKAEVEEYAKGGITNVEMEASALFAVAKYRSIKIASAFIVSDLLGKEWTPKFHRFNIIKAQNKVIDAAVDCFSSKN